MNISIQGQAASFHDLAQLKFFGPGHQLLTRDTFKEVFVDLDSGEADAACVAIENSLYGSINAVYDLLEKYHCWIVGEIYLRIEHCLIGLPGAEIAKLKEVHTHPVAMAQCEEYIDTTLAHVARFESFDTAKSVQEIMQSGDPTKAAIASRTAAEHYGGTVLAQGIETNKHNYTRFIMLKPQQEPVVEANKSSVILEAAHTPGALYHALGYFAEADINLTKLESHPIPGPTWQYRFYLDFSRSLEDQATKSVIERLEQAGNHVELLGSYQAAELPQA